MKFDIIRQPKRQTKNICDYAANFSFLMDEKEYLHIEDFLILDFALAIYNWRQKYQEDFIYIPLDSDDKVLIISKVDDGYVIKSEWNQEAFFVLTGTWVCAVDIFINKFIKYFELQGWNFKKSLKNI